MVRANAKSLLLKGSNQSCSGESKGEFSPRDLWGRAAFHKSLDFFFERFIIVKYQSIVCNY